MFKKKIFTHTSSVVFIKTDGIDPNPSKNYMKREF